MATFDEQVDAAREEYLAARNNPQALFELGSRLSPEVKEAVFRSVHSSPAQTLVAEESVRAPQTKPLTLWRYLTPLVAAGAVLFAFHAGTKVGEQRGALDAGSYAIGAVEKTMGPESNLLTEPKTRAVAGPNVTFKMKEGLSGKLTIVPTETANPETERLELTLAKGEAKSVKLPSGTGRYRVFQVSVEQAGEDPTLFSLLVVFP